MALEGAAWCHHIPVAGGPRVVLAMRGFVEKSSFSAESLHRMAQRAQSPGLAMPRLSALRILKYLSLQCSVALAKAMIAD
jgi:hypothetical protein